VSVRVYRVAEHTLVGLSEGDLAPRNGAQALSHPDRPDIQLVSMLGLERVVDEYGRTAFRF
jgi:hypothetical protein